MIRNWKHPIARWFLQDRRAISFGATLAFAALLAACSPANGPEEDPPSKADPFFYEIANAEGEVAGWMLGTIHALPDDVSWQTPAIDRAIAEADVLLVEVADLGDASAQTETFQDLATTPGLDPLALRVEPELRASLDTIVERSEIPPAHFHQTESWAAAVLLSRVDTKGKPSNGVDRAVMRKFAGRKVAGFETIASQLGIFDSLAEEDQRELLKGTVREWEKGQAGGESVLDLWIEGDETKLIAALSEGFMSDEELRAALLVDRNERWMPVLLEVLEGADRPLIAVGAAHIVGPDSLSELLEEQGYTVTRVTR